MESKLSKAGASGGREDKGTVHKKTCFHILTCQAEFKCSHTLGTRSTTFIAHLPTHVQHNSNVHREVHMFT